MNLPNGFWPKGRDGFEFAEESMPNCRHCGEVVKFKSHERIELRRVRTDQLTDARWIYHIGCFREIAGDDYIPDPEIWPGDPEETLGPNVKLPPRKNTVFTKDSMQSFCEVMAKSHLGIDRTIRELEDFVYHKTGLSSERDFTVTGVESSFDRATQLSVVFYQFAGDPHQAFYGYFIK